MDPTSDLEKKAVAENKVTKPSDNVLTPQQTPSYPVGLGITLGISALVLLVAALYFGLLNP